MAKELEIKSSGFLYSLRWTGGGEVPLVLSGQYTSQGDAEQARDAYLASKPKRKTKDGTSKSRT